jgi:4-amino-4-deoxy-L-arabinose transferase-like glycosyltransferase
MQLSKSFTYNLLAAFACLLLLAVRLYFVMMLPFAEGVEARYAEVARLMLDSQQWLLPLADYNQPSQGQAPLSIWLSAIFMRAFGEAEWVVRTPHYLAGVFILLLCQNFIRQRSEVSTIWLSLLMITNPLFWLIFGMATPVMLTVLAATLSMYNLWQLMDVTKHKTPYSVIHLGIGLALGVLTVGPLFIGLIALTLCIYQMFTAADKAPLNITAVLSALLISIVIAMPWYLAVEYQYPGFLVAFMFSQPDITPTDSDWLTGLGLWQDQRLGLIAQIAALGSALFLVLLTAWVIKHLKLTVRLSRYQYFLLSWLLATLLFALLLSDYSSGWAVLAALPLTLLLADSATCYSRYLCLCATLIVLLSCAALIWHQGLLHRSSEQKLLHNINEDLLVFYQSELSYSARFYTQGRGKAIQTLDDIRQWMLPKQPFYLVSPMTLKISHSLQCQPFNQHEHRQLSLCSLRP